MLSKPPKPFIFPLQPNNKQRKKKKRKKNRATATMALEACSFQLSSTPPAATPLTARACILKEKRLNLPTNREAKRTLSSSFSSASIPFPSLGNSGRARSELVCQATNTNIATQVLEVDDNSWDKLILESKIPALVEFWAPSCGPCKMMLPVMDELAKEYAGKISCFKINTDDSLKMASRYGIRSIPTVMLFKNGEMVESVTGAVKKSALSATIDKYLGV